MELPEGTNKEGAARNFAVMWAKHDLEAATAWAEQLPVGASRDCASQELSGFQAGMGNHDVALRLAQEVQNEDLRREAYVKALHFLGLRDVAAAEQALTGAALSHEAREQVRKELREKLGNF